MGEEAITHKQQLLVSNLKELGSVVVAFSGGVDSTFLLAIAHETLGGKVMAVIASSVIYPAQETVAASEFVQDRGIRHIVVQSDEMDAPDFVRNDPDRCYYCKRQLAQTLFNIAVEEEINCVAHGANLDDLEDYRPGLSAAEEAGMIAPLIDAKMTKAEIRFLSKAMGLSTWNKKSMACLASRIPYGVRITEKMLKMVGKAEDFLVKQGIKEVRVRHHGSVARIEVGRNEIEAFLGERFRKKVLGKFREIGFTHIALDLEGYVSGKMNRELEVINNRS